MRRFVNDLVWDIAAVPERYFEKQLSPKTDIQRSHDRECGSTKTGTVSK